MLLLPGSVYDEPSHVRVGFGRANMPEALRLLEACLGASDRLTRRAPLIYAPSGGPSVK